MGMIGFDRHNIMNEDIQEMSQSRSTAITSDWYTAETRLALARKRLLAFCEHLFPHFQFLVIHASLCFIIHHENMPI